MRFLSLGQPASRTLDAKIDWIERSLRQIEDASHVESTAEFELALGDDLNEIEALTGLGIPVRTATTPTWTIRSLVAPAAGLAIANPAGTAGNFTFSLVNDLAALEALGSTGIAVRSTADTWAQRSIAASTGITVANGSGVGGNPTVSVDQATNWNWTGAHLATLTGSPEVTPVGGFFAPPPAATVWWTHHRLYTNSTVATGTAGVPGSAYSHYTAAILRDFEGYNLQGFPRADGALFLETKKNNYKTTLYEGQVVPLYVVGVCGRRSNVACMDFGAYKVFDDSDALGYYDGSALGLEGRITRLDVAGATTQSTVVVVGWSMSTTGGGNVYFATDGTLGFCVESEVGDTFAGYAAVERAGDIEHCFVASLSRAVANIFYSVTGSAHAAGPGRTHGAVSSASFPTYAFIGDTDTGIYRPAANQIGFATSGTLRGYWDAGLAIGAPATVPTTAGDISIQNKIYVDYTNTAGGTTGAQTINKTSGKVNFAAGATSLVVTNSLVTTASQIYATALTNDTTATVKNVVPGAGSFTINLAAAATAETPVGFFVLN